ncbi:hypothetical protein FSBG_00056 [Fusobacterium gonidiaformans 3-1-5R]|uniref:Uncharacterized protein n=1 Tax=Fusobacterium gonidiaformans 3-1-5R TaxID=469605 RepID=E5BEM8_9FUSO|nr:MULTISPECIES: hypothetical protein [Fusobacterium]EFS20559.1 hypothetical protein FSBG_00056 [Fusobacterium gonidiaformans 3-1-5R]MBR8733073.1 hypothetical protein [Fusobacterium necrophorum]MBR8789383.1 hypothetical protein [Fusobacterium necrophorum]MCF0163262.1 hypothetical protein [Fusobacterium necrophorum]
MWFEIYLQYSDIILETEKAVLIRLPYENIEEACYFYYPKALIKEKKGKKYLIFMWEKPFVRIYYREGKRGKRKYIYTNEDRSLREIMYDFEDRTPTHYEQKTEYFKRRASKITIEKVEVPDDLRDE